MGGIFCECFNLYCIFLVPCRYEENRRLMHVFLGCTLSLMQWRYYGGGGGEKGGVAPPQTARLAWSRGGRHAIIYCTRPQLASYVDQTFFVTQDREKSTHPVEGAAALESIDSVERATAQESTDSVERPTTHSVPSSSGRSASTLSGGATHHKFCECFSPQTLYCCARLCTNGKRISIN